MPKGRTALPAKLKLLKAAGAQAARPSPALGTLGEPPDFLAPEAVAFWNEAAPLVEGSGFVGRLDRFAFALLASEFAAWRKSPGYRHATTFLRLAQEFGLTPASRRRLKESIPPRDDLDDFLTR